MRARLHFAWLAVCCAAAALSALAPLAVAEPTSRAPGVRGLDAAPGRALAREADRPPGALPGDGGPSTAIFPPQKLTIRFNHRLHVKDWPSAARAATTERRAASAARTDCCPRRLVATRATARVTKISAR